MVMSAFQESSAHCSICQCWARFVEGIAGVVGEWYQSFTAEPIAVVCRSALAIPAVLSCPVPKHVSVCGVHGCCI